MYELDVALTHAINGWAERNAAVDLLMIWISAIGVPLLVLAVAGQWGRWTHRLHTRHVLLAAGVFFLFGGGPHQLTFLFSPPVRAACWWIPPLPLSRTPRLPLSPRT